MLLESRLDGGILFIEAEAAGGIDKSSIPGDFQPDLVVNNVISVVSGFSRALAEAANQSSMALPAPSSLEVKFGVRVDSNSVVSISRNLDVSQFHIKVTWNQLA